MGQHDWRFCGKCNVMFFDGFEGKGVCPQGGGHASIGFNFDLPHSIAETPHDQGAWRFCDRCNAMFFDGAPNSVCPAGGGHRAQGLVFVLPHDVPPSEAAQNQWRFCNKCHGMFFDGFPNKGVCPRGAGHEAAGFDFVLPHHDEVQIFDSGTLTSDLALGGSAHLVITKSGNFTFSTHAHDSGFENIDYTLAAVLVAPSGVALSFGHQGHVEGTESFVPFGNLDRDDDQVSTGSNQAITDEYERFFNSRFVGTLKGTGAITSGIPDAIGELLAAAGTAAATAVVSG